MRDPMVYEENPQLANWDRLETNRAVFDGDVSEEIEYERVTLGKTGYSGGPKIRILGDFHYATSGGVRRPFRNSSLFTWTSKMSCPSFSIPAGPVENGGTCPASKQSSIEKEGSYEKYSPPLSEIPSGEKFICSVCYAGKGRYLMYKSMSLGQVAKLRWVQKTLRAGTFARRMSEAIASLQDQDVERVLAAKLVSNRFFRIHDSGDFFSPEYYKGWIEVCHALPMVQFWAPTRQWVYAKWHEIFSNYPPQEPGAPSVGALHVLTASVDPRHGRRIDVDRWAHERAGLELPRVRVRRGVLRRREVPRLLGLPEEAGQLPDALRTS